MVRKIELKLLPSEVEDIALIRQRAKLKIKDNPEKIQDIVITKRSIDARGSTPVFRLQIDVFVGEAFQPEPAILDQFQFVDGKPEVIIVGAGPAGYFAALELIELGIKPVVIDRGKDVRSRRRDLRAIQQFGVVNPQSNYCFGEGGAGTYSDGKLYTRSHKRGNIYKAMKLFVEHGANPDILVDAHPHIGSNKLPGIVQNIRETILHYGGEVHFESQVTDLLMEKEHIRGVVVNENQDYKGAAVILATGHSARDIFFLLDKKGILIEAKPFALGVRIEHPQALIDQTQYGMRDRPAELPAASYRLACQVENRGVFSFCMCPGGLVVPAATAPGEIVVNGMSMSRRDSAFANSGLVVAVELEDFQAYQKQGIFAGLAFQQAVEQGVFSHGDGSQKAPAQRVPDFLKGRLSENLPASSYIPGLYAAPVHQLLPQGISKRLQAGLKQFGKMMRGYDSAEAQVIATESRTSSPIRIPREKDSMMHPQIKGFYPCGEGAGYAGGIISAAMDGQNVARAAAAWITR